MRPVPQAPLRPLDPGRLPRLRQHLRVGRTSASRRRRKKAFDEPRTPSAGKNERPRRSRFRRSARSSSARSPARAAAVAFPTPKPTSRSRPKALGGPEIKVDAGPGPAQALFDWMRSPDNPFFARSFVNRVWGHYFGVGIVDPVDDFSLANPPSNRQAARRPGQGLHRAANSTSAGWSAPILLSRTYQLSSDANATNRLDRNNYSHSYVRPMMAEVVVDVLNDAPGRQGELRHRGAGRVPGHRDRRQPACQNRTVNYAFRIFGRPPRTTACDCERAMEPALPQKLFLMTDPTRCGQAGRAGQPAQAVARRPQGRQRGRWTNCSWPR